MVGQSKVVYLNTHSTSSAGVETLNELCRLAEPGLETMLRQALDQVDDALFDRAERAANNADQALFFATMRQVRMSRRMVVQTFTQEMESAFSRLTQPHSSQTQEPAATAREDYSLELMDETVVEERVAAETVVGKLRTRSVFPLAQLQSRLDYLVVERKVDERNNPLDPRQVVDAFAVAMERLNIEIQPKLIIFKLFEKQALRQLPALYEAANRLLIDAGIMPKLRATGEPLVANEDRVQAPESGHQTSVDSEADTLTGNGSATLELLQGLLAQARGGNQPVPSTARCAGGASHSDLVQALSALQQQPRFANNETGGAQPFAAEELKALLGSALFVAPGGLPQPIERAADDTIDIVSMLFDIILDDSRLAPSIKAVIARLQIPVLKVAMLDRSFFNSRQHPARALINELAHAAMGWVEPENPSADPLYRKMNEVMNRILEGFEEDIVLFEQVLQDFRLFLEQERERAQTVEARTCQAAEGKAKVEDARERVQAEIERRLRGGSVPSVVHQILEGPWFKVLFITCVKDGPQGAVWESQLELMDRLIWSVQPNADPERRQDVLARIPALLNDLREGLNAILYNPFEMTRLFEELEAEHIRCLSAPPADLSDNTVNVEQGSEDESAFAQEGSSYDCDEPSVAAEPPQLTEEQCLREECLQRLVRVDLGTWFEFSTDAGRQLRAKLSARLNGGRRLIFVNRAGFKLADKKTEEVAADLSSGKAFILDHNMLFDKALEQVITNLRDLRVEQAL
ncbi:DUF1631 domain-containing protein [Nitrococcus mobilis]|uniref:Thymidine phosphorylase n=1 Tax=Nitrococcus mobilis Nb-231 TaxID=314278 RepID=A4BTA0_9GAMM|nr:DUF1631 domain-containing protein [Nitrococcus mobilis]EAR21002.1 hypothetical protein NB231_07527 [Nitrococcus mobilis Nb-231]